MFIEPDFDYEPVCVFTLAILAQLTDFEQTQDIIGSFMLFLCFAQIFSVRNQKSKKKQNNLTANSSLILRSKGEISEIHT